MVAENRPSWPVVRTDLLTGNRSTCNPRLKAWELLISSTNSFGNFCHECVSLDVIRFIDWHTFELFWDTRLLYVAHCSPKGTLQYFSVERLTWSAFRLFDKKGHNTLKWKQNVCGCPGPTLGPSSFFSALPRPLSYSLNLLPGSMRSSAQTTSQRYFSWRIKHASSDRQVSFICSPQPL